MAAPPGPAAAAAAAGQAPIDVDLADDAASGGEAGAGAVAGGKRRRYFADDAAKKKHELDLANKRFDSMTTLPGHNWKADAAARNAYLSTGELTCLDCREAKDVGANTGACKKHVETDKHKAKAKLRASEGEKAIMAAFVQPVVVLSPAEKAAQKVATLDTRALWTAAVAAHNVAPATISTLFGKVHVVARVARALEARGYNGVAGTMHTDLPHAAELQAVSIADKLKDQWVSVTTDGATFQREKAFGIIASSCDESYLIDIVFPDDGAAEVATYSADKAAVSVLAACKTYGIDVKKITCMIGDGVTFNNALADALKVKRGRCLAHACALLVKKAWPAFTGLKTLVQDSAAIMSAGGSGKRRVAAVLAGLDPNKLSVYGNRFASALAGAQYRADNFPVIKAFYTGAAVQQGMGEEEEEGDESEGDERAKLSKKATKVRTAYMDRLALVKLRIVLSLYGQLIDLIPLTSADGDKTDLTVVDRFALLSSSLTTAKAFPQLTVTSAAAACGVVLTAAETTRLQAMVTAAVDISLASFATHVTPVINVLQLRFLYSMRNDREPRVAPTVHTHDFYGCLPMDLTPSLVAEYSAFRTYWREERAKDVLFADCPLSRVSTHAFWKSKASLWPTLSKLALYWAEFPTSAIAVERAFAIMRQIEVPHRVGSMAHSTFVNEMRFRFNRAALEGLLEATAVRAGLLPRVGAP